MSYAILWGCIALAGFLSFSSSASAVTRTWTNPAGGSWQSHLNWSPPGVPTATDDVFITLDNSYTVTIDGTANARSLTVGLDNTTHFITLDVNSGSLTLWGVGTARQKCILKVTGGTLNVNFGMSINGSCVVTAGVLAANSNLIINGPCTLGGGTLKVEQPVAANGLFSWAGGQVAGLGTLNLNSTSVWTSGSMNEAGVTRIAPLALLTIDGAADKVLAQRQLLNHGTLKWQGSGRVILQSGGVLTNVATFHIANNSTLFGSIGTGTFYNAGLTVKTSSTGTATFDGIGFINRGTIDVANGFLQIRSGGTNIGVWNPSLNGRIDLTAGTMYFDTGCLLTGPGTTRLAGANLYIMNTNAGGAAIRGTLQHESGNLIGEGDLFVTGGTYNWRGGLLTDTGSLVIQDVIIPGSGKGVPDQVVTGLLHIAANTDLRIAGRKITNFASTTWSSNGNLRADNGNTFYNYGLFSIENDRSFSLSGLGNGPPPVLANYGVVRKSSTGTTLMDGWLLYCEGELDIQAGVIRFFRDTHIFKERRATLSGAGLMLIEGASIYLEPKYEGDPPMNVTLLAHHGNIQLNSGVFGGSPSAGNGTFTWVNGDVWGIPSGMSCQMHFVGPSLKKSSGRHIENVGTGTWSGSGDILLLGASFSNNGLFLIQNDARFTGNLFPGGIIRKLGTTGRTIFRGGMALGGGLVEAITGTLEFTASLIPGPNGAPLPVTCCFAPGPNGKIELRGDYVLLGTNTGGEGAIIITNAWIRTPTNGIGPEFGGKVEFAQGVLEPRGPPVRISGLFEWHGMGLFTGTGRTDVLPNGTLRLVGPVTKTNHMAEIHNGGTIQWVAGDFRLVDDVTLINTNLFLMQTSSRFIGENGARFVGLADSHVTRNNATGVSVVEDVNFEQAGHFDIQDGKLFLRSGQNTWLEGADVLGPGLLVLTGAVFNIADSKTRIAVRGNFEVAAGNLTGPGSMDVIGNCIWRGGLIDGKGSLSIQTGGILTLVGPGLRRIIGRSLTNAGTVNWDDTGSVESSAFFLENTGSINLRGDGTWRHNGIAPSFFRNLGAIVRDPSLGTSLWQDMNVTNAGIIRAHTGVLRIEPGYVQTIGATVLEGGSVSGPSIEIFGGDMRGTGTVSGNVFNRSTLRPGLPVGALKIVGNYTQSPDGSLVVELGGPNPLTQYDRLEVTEDAFLGGKLTIVRTNGYVPATNHSFTVLVSGDRGGVFRPVTGRWIDGNMALTPLYAAGDVTLVITNVAPRFGAVPPEFVNGELRFRLEGLEGEEYVIEHSQNLIDWLPLRTNVIVGVGYTEVADPNTGLQSRRFYRARFMQYD